jgi:hypothetical protein
MIHQAAHSTAPAAPGQHLHAQLRQGLVTHSCWKRKSCGRGSLAPPRIASWFPIPLSFFYWIWNCPLPGGCEADTVMVLCPDNDGMFWKLSPGKISVNRILLGAPSKSTGEPNPQPTAHRGGECRPFIAYLQREQEPRKLAHHASRPQED